MSNLAFSVGTWFEPVDCVGCGKYFAMSDAENKRLLKSHGTFSYPYCKCDQHYTGKSEEQKLKEQVAALKRGKDLAERQAQNEREEAKYQKNCARAQKAAKTRLKNRVKNGICPCCNRTFKQLAAHMKNKHPEYVSK